jgi:bifunctional non-homologous end joining protein LigD
MSAFELHMRDGRVVETCVVDDVASLVWLANQGVLEFHPFLARAEAFDRPTAMVFDLDPGAPAGLVECAQVALRLRDVLAAVGLESFVKVSGSIGMHVVVPLNTPVTYEETKSFARAVATLLAHEDPARVVDVMTRARRSGKVFVDWAQNDERKQNIAPYSLRAAAGVPVSAPITWEEAASVDRTRFGPREVLDRVRDRGDVFAQVPTMRQQLPRLHA